jgi:hypothetical protein
VPGMKGYRGRPYAPYYGYRPRRPFSAPYGYAPYGSGWSSLLDSILTCGVHISYGVQSLCVSCIFCLGSGWLVVVCHLANIMSDNSLFVVLVDL